MQTIIVGERLNSSNKKIKKIFESRDLDSLMKVVRAQVEGGAEYIDINASLLMDGEKDAMLWAGKAVTAECAAGISVDSPDGGVLGAGIAEFGERCMVNSVTCDSRSMDELFPMVKSAGAGMIVILKNIDGIPETAGGRLRLASEAAGKAASAGIEPERIFFDPMITPMATESEGLTVTLETLSILRTEFPQHNRIGGLSNVSFGMPLRKLVNRTFMSMLIAGGMTALICDPTDKNIVDTLRASEALLGRDPGCRRFLQHYRKMES